MTDLAQTAATMVVQGKGILAADESVSTITKRFDALGIPSTPTTRRDFRELLITTPGIGEFISGVILHDETIRQQSSRGIAFSEMCAQLGILSGIKVDAGARPLAGHAGELVTEGLDNLRERLAEYRRLGARFSKWRAVLGVNHRLPSAACIVANAEAIARFAALSQEQGLVPIVEPEVLMDGPHTIERCEQVTAIMLHAVFDALFEHGVRFEGMLLKPNMVVPGDECPRQVDAPTVAAATLRALRRHVPPAVPGIVFLSGGQRDVDATRHLDEINRTMGARPWKLSFSFSRALENAPMAIWAGNAAHAGAAQAAFYHRARCNSLAALGAYGDLEERHIEDAEARPTAP